LTTSDGKQIIKMRDGEQILYMLDIYMFRHSNSIIMTIGNEKALQMMALG
jgi:hypothetical protein